MAQSKPLIQNSFLSLAFIAVWAESLLVPFYPQFFSERFAIDEASHTGYYFSACRLALLIGFPIWALISQKIKPLKLLALCQAVAGGLSLLCYWAPSLSWFWTLSIAMVLFKSSYLLMYPLLMEHGEKTHQARTIGSLSMLIHLAIVLSTLFSGFLFKHWNPQSAFLLIGVADFIQMAVSIWLIGKIQQRTTNEHKAETTQENQTRLGSFLGVAFLFFLGSTLIRPYFTSFMETQYMLDTVELALLFGIPNLMALLSFPLFHRLFSQIKGVQLIFPSLVLACVGLLLQALPQFAWVIVGRIVFGGALFFAQVGIDLQLFQGSSPSSYTKRYSQLHIFQNLGLLLAPFIGGLIVEHFGYASAFQLGALVLMLAIPLLWFTIRQQSKTSAPLSALTSTDGKTLDIRP